MFSVDSAGGQPVQITVHFKKRRRDELLVAVAGVAMNLSLRLCSQLLPKLVLMAATSLAVGNTLGSGIWEILIYIVQINIVLMIFNLIPVPPLDGFNIIANIIGFAQTETYWRIYRYGNWILVAIIVFGVTGYVISPCVQFFMSIFWNIML